MSGGLAAISSRACFKVPALATAKPSRLTSSASPRQEPGVVVDDQCAGRGRSPAIVGREEGRQAHPWLGSRQILQCTSEGSMMRPHAVRQTAESLRLISPGTAWHGACSVPALLARTLSRRSRGGDMLWTIFVILAVLWLLGMVSSYTMGGVDPCPAGSWRSSCVLAQPARRAEGRLERERSCRCLVSLVSAHFSDHRRDDGEQMGRIHRLRDVMLESGQERARDGLPPRRRPTARSPGPGRRGRAAAAARDESGRGRPLRAWRCRSGGCRAAGARRDRTPREPKPPS